MLCVDHRERPVRSRYTTMLAAFHEHKVLQAKVQAAYTLQGDSYLDFVQRRVCSSRR